MADDQDGLSDVMLENDSRDETWMRLASIGDFLRGEAKQCGEWRGRRFRPAKLRRDNRLHAGISQYNGEILGTRDAGRGK